MPSIGAVPHILEDIVRIDIGEMLLSTVDRDGHERARRPRSRPGGVDDPLVGYAGRSLGELL